MISKNKPLTDLVQIIKGERIIIQELRLPLALRSKFFGAAFYNESRLIYQIAINADLPPCQKHLTIGHELAHICLGHFTTSYDNVAEDEKELEADTYAQAFYKAYKEETIPAVITAIDRVIDFTGFEV